MDWHFWLYMVLIIIGSLAFQFLIGLPYFFTDEDEQEDEQETEPEAKPVKSEKVKQRTEKDMFIEAYKGMFNDTLQNAEHVYKTTDAWSRKILIEQWQLQQNS